jgi:hypothetical protein
MRYFTRYKMNLRQVNDNIYSYDTHVATVVYDKDYKPLHLEQLGWWSVTTQRHINYAASELGLEIVKSTAYLNEG